jgi:hypothetical protein
MNPVHPISCKPSDTQLVQRSFEVVEDNCVAKTLEHEAKLMRTAPVSPTRKQTKHACCTDRGKLTFQKGFIPSGMASLRAPVTLMTSSAMNTMERHIEPSMSPKRGHSRTSSMMPKL